MNTCYLSAEYTIDTFACRAENQHWLVDGVLLQNPIKFCVQHRLKDEVILLPFPEESIHEFAKPAWPKFFTELGYR